MSNESQEIKKLIKKLISDEGEQKIFKKLNDSKKIKEFNIFKINCVYVEDSLDVYLPKNKNKKEGFSIWKTK